MDFKAPYGRAEQLKSLDEVQGRFADMFRQEMAKFPELKVCRWSVGNGGRYFPHNKTIIVPLPKSRKSIHICFHEIGHHAQGEIRPRYLEEMRAEQWAFDKMREYGLSVPLTSIHRAKRYVVRKVNQAISRGHKNSDVLPEVVTWLGDFKDQIWWHTDHSSRYDHLRKVKDE